MVTQVTGAPPHSGARSDTEIRVCHRMKFSIVTASYKASHWLKMCLPSVADQGVDSEHLVQDACSPDGTQDWLPYDPRVKAVIEKDGGMYDAINRGLRRAQGDILSYLNADEQYLPGALQKVGRYFQEHPEIDIAFAHALVVDPQGQFICYRKALTPQIAHSLVSDNLSFLTCATFFRRRLIEERNLYFNTQWRNSGDAAWGIELVKSGVRMGVLDDFTSSFADTGENMNLNEQGKKEKAQLFAMAPWWARVGRHAVVAHYRLRKLLQGHYSQAPFSYAIYTPTQVEKRTEFRVDHPTSRWIRH